MSIDIVNDDFDYEALPSELSPVIHMGAGAAAGVMEHTLMYPLDSVKVSSNSEMHTL